MKYLEPSFSTFAVGSDEYRDNWDAIFAKKAEPEVAGSCDQPSREAEFAEFDRRVAEVEAKVTAGNYDDARVSDTYTPEEALLHALYNWRDELRSYLDREVLKYKAFVENKTMSSDARNHYKNLLQEVEIIRAHAYSGPTKNIRIHDPGPSPGSSVEWTGAIPLEREPAYDFRAKK